MQRLLHKENLLGLSLRVYTCFPRLVSEYKEESSYVSLITQLPADLETILLDYYNREVCRSMWKPICVISCVVTKPELDYEEVPECDFSGAAFLDY